MVTLKKRIKTIDSLPKEKKKKITIINILTTLISIITLFVFIILLYKNSLPYINAIDINKITGKKTYITECNTKDYIIIGKDKSYSISITNDNCETNHYEGNITIKNNEITFTEEIKGIIDNNYNIIINNKIFESDKNE